jgi:transcriptional regulator with XRE-family HTH domain
VLDREAFEKRLYKLRKDTGMTTRIFEEKVINMTNWYAYEKGKCLPGIDSVIIICNALNINIEWFLTGQGHKERAVYAGCESHRLPTAGNKKD